MRHVQDNAEENVRRAISALKPGAFELAMDSGAVISVRIEVDREARSATVDFTGTSAQLDSNFNVVGGESDGHEDEGSGDDD